MTVADLPARERPLSEQYRIVAKAFAEAYGDASYLRNTRTGELAKMVKRIMGQSNEKMSNAKAEMEAKASDHWFDFNLKLAKAEERVEVLRAQKKYLEMLQWEHTDANANIRAEKRM